MQALLAWLNKLAIIASRRAEVAAAILVMGIILMMILPLPTGLVDVLIALNISASALLIVLSLYLPGPVAFSSFPSVLLLTTLFRLGIAISTTRLILLIGDAGDIVNTFGEFVVGGNIVVGLVVFLILTVVQFIVITKGSERVAEVSARFTLDAIPGKQMAIDSDVRSGLIDHVTAQKKRDALAKESQLHGAMDGAMKFVKGDAIAGLVIVFINLIGGITIGVAQRDLSFGEAIHHYSILTIGDGLIAQIPALLIALTAGMMITRVADSADKKRNVGQEIVQQMLSEPKAWIVASALMLVFAIIPGMPWYVFLSLACISGGIGWVGNRRAMHQEGSEAVEKRNAQQAGGEVDLSGDTDLKEFVPVRNFVFQVSEYAYQLPITREYIRVLRRTRNRLVMQFGLTISAITFEPSRKYKEDEYAILIHEIPVYTSRFRFDQVRIRLLLDQELPSDVSLEEDLEAMPWEIAHWVTYEQGLEKKLSQYFLMSSLQQFSVICERTLFQNAHRFVGIQESHTLVSWIEGRMSEAGKELQKNLPTPKFAEVLRRLIVERVGLRNIKQIVETLVEWATRERDPIMLTEYVRTGLSAQLCLEFSKGGELFALLLDPDLEDVMRGAIRQTAQGNFLALENDTSRAILDQIIAKLSQLTPDHPFPVIVTTQDLRRYVRKLVEDELFDLHVLSFTELTPTQKVQPLAHIGLPDEVGQSADDLDEYGYDDDNY